VTVEETLHEPSTPSVRRGRLFVAVFLPLFALFLVTANTDLPYHIDPATNVFAAWTIGTTGSPVLHEYAELADPEFKGVFAWVVPSPRGPVAQYPPGTALLAAPLYAVWSEADEVVLTAENAPPEVRVTVPIPNLWPAAAVASATVAAALGLVALTVVEAGGSVRMAAATVVVAATATSAWTVAADQLWQHGPNMLWIALGVWLAARQRWGLAGLAFGALAITRPPVVLVGATLGVWLLVRRDVRSAGLLLAGVTPGVMALVAYNRWLFGQRSISGGYGSAFAERATSGGASSYLANVAAGLFDPAFGLLVFSPFLILAVAGAVRVGRQLPGWSVAAAAGGVIYLLVQWKLNRASGGAGFSYYRYPLEALTASAPVLATGWARIWNTGKLGRLGLVATGAYAAASHLAAVVG
jgi:hypothetical protein